MLVYLKENGYPVSIWIETADAKDEKGIHWGGYESVVTDEYGVIIDVFTHRKLRDRALWAKGFFKGKEYIQNEKI